MPSLEIYNSTATGFGTFVPNLVNFITSNGFMSVATEAVSYSNLKDINSNSIRINATSSYYSSNSLRFKDFGNDANKYCLFLFSGRYYSGARYIHSIRCIPAIKNYNNGNAFYSDESKLYTEINISDEKTNSDTPSSIYSNFRAMKYSTDTTKFLSLGLPNESITISTHVFKSIDDPTNTKTVFIITDKDGYVSFYDSYTPYPWHVENTYHNGNNIGHTSSINAYKLAIKGYYCDNLYYFDGAYSMPGEGVSTIGGIKFLKLGDSNLFIKME